jgi:2-desacetyl-2-hydroxyethyl bacteriochlorophyllide A dehydrogenase
MRQLVWCGADEVQLREVPDPSGVLGEREVLVAIKAVGICGTDIHIMRGNMPGANPPMILGHEFSGVIAAVGSKVTRLTSGNRVTLDSVTGCGHCELCLQGRAQICPQTSEFGMNRDGACQDFLVLPEANAHLIPDCISFEEAAILDMEVWNAIRKCGVDAGDRVLILGAGPIGLMACQLVRILGAGHVTLSDSLAIRLEQAESLGLADAYVSEPLSRIANGTNSSGFAYDMVMDCAGTSSSTQCALDAVKPAGRVLLYGLHEAPMDGVDINQIVLKDIVIFGAQSDRTHWDEVIGLVAAGKYNLKSLITHRYPIEDATQAYDAVRRREPGLIKALLLL